MTEHAHLPRTAAVRWFVLALALPVVALPAAFAQDTKPVPVASPSVAPDTVDPGQIWCAAFAADGRTIATVSGFQKTPGQLIVWDAATGRARWLRPEKLGVRSATFSPDGKTIAIACYEGTVKLLDPANGKERAVLQGHKDGVNAVAFTPDGKALATASLDGT